MPLEILPKPKQLARRGGGLDLSGDVPLWLSPLAGEEELTAALAFAGEARGRCGARLPIEKPFNPPLAGRHVRFLLFGRDARLAPELKRLARPGPLGAEGYVLDVDGRRALAAANTPRGLLHAAQTLRQMVEVRGGRARLPGCRIVDWPDFQYRGVMLDVSRFKVPSLATLLWLAETLAALKINVLQLYVEHPFAWRRHPAVGRGIGPLAAEEILLLGRRCRELGIELQANQQSFGHHRHLLSRRGYGRFAELPEGWRFDLPAGMSPWLNKRRLVNWSLSPAVPASYRLLGELYDEVLPLYAPELFNADCDETWDLGLGRSRARCGRLGRGRVYLEHILKIHRLARARGKRLMIWGDILLDHPELIRKLPPDLVVLDWAYDAQRDRRKTVRQFARAGLEFWVCPGVGSWGSVFPRVEVARVNIRKFAEAGKAFGATGLLNTDWGDDGHANLQGHSLHGYAYGAEQAWSAGPAGDGDFDRRLAWALFRDPTARFGALFRELGLTNAPFGKDRPLDYASYPFAMLWDSFRKIHPRAVMGKWKRASEPQLRASEGHARRALALIAGLRRDFRAERLLLDECALAARQTLAACRRERVFEPARLALAGEGRLSARQRAELAALRAQWRGFRREFERLWTARSKRSQIAYRLGRYRQLDREYGQLLARR